MPLAPERWQKVKRLFDAAVELAPEERASFVRRESNGDSALFREVESLLAADAEASTFIEQPAGMLPRELLGDEADEMVGRPFGAYEIIREIGRGGLGTVYLARRADDVYRKEVALKVIRRGLDTEDILRRFKNERQILAQLDHPNIARLIDGGTSSDGLPYFVMDYVEGQPIDTYCSAKQLGLSDRLAVFRKVCAAVTFAHQNLVIHRDLKPSNIVVTKEGEPKLLDFGIAKLLTTEEQLYSVTLPALRVMTPDYASPEQVKGEKITTASDVYSLGVLLYELLTGTKPYRVKTYTPQEISRAVTEQEPTRPSTVRAGDKSLRGDLDNIVLMALRKEPQRRYSSVAQLSDDIRRYLERRPVVAHKDSLAYRAAKFVRRNRVAVTAAVVLLVTLLAGIVATSWQAQRATEQARVAARERDRAQRRFADVRQLANALLFDIAPQIERLEGSTKARIALVTRALQYLDSLAEEAGDDRTLQSELAAAYEKIGELQGSPRKPNLNDFNGSENSYTKARLIRNNLFAQTHDPAQLKQLALDLSALASLHWIKSEIKAALETSQSAVDAFSALLRAQPQTPQARLGLAEAQIDLARAHYFNGQYAKVYPPLTEALVSLEQLRQVDAKDVESLRLLLNGYSLLGITLSWDNKQAQGEAEMKKALDIGQSLIAENPHDSVIQQALLEAYRLASQLYESVDNPRAFAILQTARQLAENLVHRDAADVQARNNLARTYSMLGKIAIQLKKQDEAMTYLNQSAQIFAELERNDPTRIAYKHEQARVVMMLGNTHQFRHDYPAAVEAYDRATALFDELSRLDSENSFHYASVGLVSAYEAQAYASLAEQANGDQRAEYVRQAHEIFQRAERIYGELDAQHALSETERAYLEQARAAINQL